MRFYMKVVVSLIYSTVLWINILAAPFKNQISYDDLALSNVAQPEMEVEKRVHGLSLLRMNKFPKLQKRVHNLSLLRMGKLFKPNANPQVKRYISPSLWRILAAESLIKN
ncbi:hypothetical protein FO519_006776 [Halicephalobus sp. NKZ332]|nr:hypothetical protein FO519_006776 [Halicephalobus sp. NKZ332]